MSEISRELTSRWIYDDKESGMYLSAAVTTDASNENQNWGVNISKSTSNHVYSENFNNMTREDLEALERFIKAILSDSM